MKRKLLLYVIMFWSHMVFAQWRYEKKLNWKDLDQFEIGNNGHIYVTNSSGDMAKFSAQGEFQAEYSPLINDKIHRLIINNQMKIYLFYQNFQKIVVLDRYFASPVIYSLSNYGFGFISEISTDNERKIWLVDQFDFSLKLFDPGRTVLLETKSLNKILIPNRAEDVTLVSHQNRTYLFQENNVVVFDNLGNYLRNMALPSGENYSFYKDEIYFVLGEELVFINLYDGGEKRLSLPSGVGRNVRFFNDTLYEIHPHGFSIYKYLSEKK